MTSAEARVATLEKKVSDMAYMQSDVTYIRLSVARIEQALDKHESENEARLLSIEQALRRGK